jgi:hypothetical protein
MPRTMNQQERSLDYEKTNKPAAANFVSVGRI